MKKLTAIKLIFAIGVAVLTVLPIAQAANAAGYGPYGPYIPEDTGLATGIFSYIALFTYVGGTGAVLYSRLLKNNAKKIS